MPKLEPNYSQEVARKGRERFVGKRFRHYKNGAIYVVIDVVVLESPFVVLIVYENCDGELRNRWARPRDEFFQVVDFDEMEWKPIQRFTFVEGE